jgi:hypothetical protein
VKRSLNLDRVVLLGRTLEEYVHAFGLDPASLRGQRVLDAAAGVSSFCAEARRQGVQVTSFDPIYRRSAADIERQCITDLDHVAGTIGDVKAYRWGFYENPQNMRLYRERAYKDFLADYRHQQPDAMHYIAGEFPRLPFADAEFHLSLVSYFLFVYEAQLTYGFHRDSIRELMRVTGGEARIYPLVTFEAERSGFLDRVKSDPLLREFEFEEVPTDFEFLWKSNSYLRIRRRQRP